MSLCNYISSSTSSPWQPFSKARDSLPCTFSILTNFILIGQQPIAKDAIIEKSTKMHMRDVAHDLQPNNSFWAIFPTVPPQLAASSNTVIRAFLRAGGSQPYISLQLYIQSDARKRLAFCLVNAVESFIFQPLTRPCNYFHG